MTIIASPQGAARRDTDEPARPADDAADFDDDLDDEFGDEFEEALRSELMRNGTIADA